jgi:hypothetical protein
MARRRNMKTETYHLRSADPPIDCDIQVDEFFIKVSPTLAQEAARDKELRKHGQAMAVLFYLLFRLPYSVKWADRVTKKQIAKAIGVSDSKRVGDLGAIVDDLHVLERLGYIAVTRINTGSTIALRMVSDDEHTRGEMTRQYRMELERQSADARPDSEEKPAKEEPPAVEERITRSDSAPQVSTFEFHESRGAQVQIARQAQQTRPATYELANYIYTSDPDLSPIEREILKEIRRTLKAPAEYDGLDAETAARRSEAARSAYQKEMASVFPHLFECVKSALAVRVQDVWRDRWDSARPEAFTMYLIADVEADAVLKEYFRTHKDVAERAATAESRSCEEGGEENSPCVQMDSREQQELGEQPFL